MESVISTQKRYVAGHIEIINYTKPHKVAYN